LATALSSGCAQTRIVSPIAFFESGGKLPHSGFRYYPLKVAARQGWVAVVDGSPNLGFRNSRVLVLNKATGVSIGQAEIPRGGEKGAKGHGVSIDAMGRIYVAVEDVGKTHLLRLTPGSSGSLRAEWDHFAGMSYPTGIFVAPPETMYLVDGGNHRIIRLAWKGFDPAVIGSSRDLETPRGIAVDKQGNLYTHVVRTGKIWVLKYAPDGRLLQSFPVEGVEEPLAWFYNDLALDSAGRLYLSDYAKSRVLVLGEGGKVVQEIAQPGFKGPMGLAFDEDDVLYVADAWTKEVFRLRPVHEHEVRERAAKSPKAQPAP
jgi:hypothetical protein